MPIRTSNHGGTTTLVALLLLSLFAAPNPVDAEPPKQEDILDLIPVVIFSSAVSEYNDYKLRYCDKGEKPVTESTRLSCGIAGASYVDNYYVFYVNEGEEVAQRIPFMTTKGGKLSAESCEAQSLEVTYLSSVDDIPANTIPGLELEIALEKGLGRKPVFLRIRVHDGKAAELDPVYISLLCVKALGPVE